MQYKYSAGYQKLLAWILILASLVLGYFSAIITLIGLNYGYYTQDDVYQTSWQCAEQVRVHGYDIIDQFDRNPSEEAWKRLLQDSSLRFIILDEITGDVVTSYTEGMNLNVPENFADNVYLKEYNGTMRLGEADSFLRNVYVMDHYFGYDAEGRFWNGSNSVLEGEYHTILDTGRGFYAVEAIPQLETPQSEETTGKETRNYQILYLLPKSLRAGNSDRVTAGYVIYRETMWWSARTPWMFGICLAIFLAALIFLCVQTGRKPGREEICGTWLEKIPLEIHLFVDFWAFVGIVGLCVLNWDMQSNSFILLEEWYLVMVLCALGSMVCAAVLVEMILTIVLRAKLGILWSSTLCSRVFRWIGRRFRWFGGIITKGLRSIGMVPGRGADHCRGAACRVFPGGLAGQCL